MVKPTSENSLKVLHGKFLISRSGLARETCLSVATLNRIKKGRLCGLDMKGKIGKAIGVNRWLKNDGDKFPETQRGRGKDSPRLRPSLCQEREEES